MYKEARRLLESDVLHQAKEVLAAVEYLTGWNHDSTLSEAGLKSQLHWEDKQAAVSKLATLEDLPTAPEDAIEEARQITGAGYEPKARLV